MSAYQHQRNGLPNQSLLREARQEAVRSGRWMGLYAIGCLAAAAVVGYRSISYVLGYSPKIPHGSDILSPTPWWLVALQVSKDLFPGGDLSSAGIYLVLALFAAGFGTFFLIEFTDRLLSWPKPGRTPEETAKRFWCGIVEEPRHEYNSWICAHSSGMERLGHDQNASDYPHFKKFWQSYYKNANTKFIVKKVEKIEEQDNQAIVRVPIERKQGKQASTFLMETCHLKKIGDYWYILNGTFEPEGYLAATHT